MKIVEADQQQKILKYNLYNVVSFNENSKEFVVRVLKDMQNPYDIHKYHEKSVKNLVNIAKSKRGSVFILQQYSFIHPSFYIRCLAASEYERFYMDDKPGKDCLQVCLQSC